MSFAAGFALLPFLWCVNSIWFFAEAFRKPPYDEQKEIKKCKFWPEVQNKSSLTFCKISTAGSN